MMPIALELLTDERLVAIYVAVCIVVIISVLVWGFRSTSETKPQVNWVNGPVIYHYVLKGDGFKQVFRIPHHLESLDYMVQVYTDDGQLDDPAMKFYPNRAMLEWPHVLAKNELRHVSIIAGGGS